MALGLNFNMYGNGGGGGQKMAENWKADADGILISVGPLPTRTCELTTSKRSVSISCAPTSTILTYFNHTSSQYTFAVSHLCCSGPHQETIPATKSDGDGMIASPSETEAEDMGRYFDAWDGLEVGVVAVNDGTVLTQVRPARLRYPALHADVSHLRTCLEARDALKVRRDNLRRLEAEASKDQFHLDMNMSSVRKRLQYARIIPLISDRYVELMTKLTRPRHSSELRADSADEMPLPLRAGGPSEMPRLQGEGSTQIVLNEGGETHASGVAVSPTAWMSAS
ncbi:hypothetical protein EDB89DRAFT_2078584 [Lactarius sanguifluus]|nr:hypothetical protein EDB89DRAFT_2078584 [Lactarius sanguifluus]